MQASGTLADSGVDDAASAVLTTERGARAIIDTTLRSNTPISASVNGSLARIESGEPFHDPSPLALISADGLRRLDWNDERYPGREWLAFQASAMARYVGDGLTESPIHSLDDSVAIMSLLDEMRRQVGARFMDENREPEAGS